MTQNGQAFELPMPERPTSVSESLLLRSPTASQGEGGALGEAVARERGNTVGIRDQAMDIARLQGHKVSREVANLPTPTVSYQYTGNLSSKQHSEGSLHSVSLAQIVNRPDLLPTPIVRDYKDGSAAQSRNGKVSTDTVARAVFNSGEIMLQTPQVDDAKNTGHNQSRRITLASQVWANHETNWGKFEPAIRGWEAIIGRPAPEPTKPDGKEGNHRLSSKFTEWMMGLPDGWITDIGLKRNDELKACGNGVVPQQAELALSLLGIKEILER
jgi:DNA (cytosine-5)-methyltransferase 1